jgi:D-alanyl-D-alanine carboxypeptidase (penicillin-binding protein 5/6)
MIVAMPTPVLIGKIARGDKRRVARVAVAILVACVCLGAPELALASVRDGDRVDGTTPKALGIPRAAMPDVSTRAGALVTQDGRVLWSRNLDDRRSMASITKIMTAVVALERTRPDESVTVPDVSERVGESTSFLRSGEKLPMSELLEALLVKSGNDAAVAIAEHVSGNEDAFVALMNEKATELGLAHTHFKNSHGLDQKGHYSSVRDLAVLARYAMTKRQFREVVARKRAKIGSGKRAEQIENTNVLIGNYTGANGVKTGWTDAAGYCVIASARRGHVELYAVVLGSGGELARFKDATELLDFGFAHYREQLLSSAGTVIGEAPVSDYLDVAVPAAVSENTSVAVFDVAGPITRSVRVSSVDAPIETGERVGVATFTQNGEVIASVPLVAVESVPRPSPLQRVGIAIMRMWRRLTGTTSAGAVEAANPFAAAGVSY